MKVPGMGPNLTFRLLPSTLLRSQKSGFPELDSVSSMRVAGDCPVMPRHQMPKLLGGAPQSPVVQTNFPSFQLQPVLAQYLMATVLAATWTVYQVLGGISHPVWAMSGTPNPPTQIVFPALFLNLKVLACFQAWAEWSRASMATSKTRAAVVLMQELIWLNLSEKSLIKIVMIGTPGLFKFFWPKDNVEVKYNSIYEIPVMNINKQIVYFDSKKDENIILVHIKDTKTDVELVKTIMEKARNKVYIIPDQHSTENFEQIKKVYPEALGKMILNGPDAHPLAKFMKKNSQKLYDFEMFGSSKLIPTAVFHKNGERTSFYCGDTLKDFVKSL